MRHGAPEVDGIARCIAPCARAAPCQSAESRAGKCAGDAVIMKQGLVKGKVPHPGGARIRAEQGLQRLVVRWALTDRPAAAEEELHRACVVKFGRLPEYVRST